MWTNNCSNDTPDTRGHQCYAKGHASVRNRAFYWNSFSFQNGDRATSKMLDRFRQPLRWVYFQQDHKVQCALKVVWFVKLECYGVPWLCHINLFQPKWQLKQIPKRRIGFTWCSSSKFRGDIWTEAKTYTRSQICRLYRLWN